jgi:IS5 family transposase
MIKLLWTVFIQNLWPLLWPIFRELMTDVAQDLATWIKKIMSDRFESKFMEQQQRADERASSAERRSEQASSDEERVKAAAEAKAWREIAEELRRDNAALKQELEDVVRQSQVYARKRIDSEAERDKAQERVFSLKAPEQD